MIITVGIDPGKTGAVAVVADGTEILAANTVPKAGNGYLPGRMAATLVPFAGVWHDRATPLQLLHSYTALVDAVQNPELTDEQFERCVTMSQGALACYLGRRDRIVLAMIEKQRGRKGEGPERLVQIGKGWGMWEGICAGLCIPFEEVAGGTWERSMGCIFTKPTAPKQKDGEEDAAFKKREKSAAAKARRDKKATHVVKASQLFPDLPLRATDDGLADALLLAVYAFRRYQGREG